VPETFTEEVKINHQVSNPKFHPTAHPGSGGSPVITYTRIVLDAEPAHVVAGGDGGNGRVTVTAKDDQPMAELIAGDTEAVIAAGQKGARPGRLTLYDGNGQPTINVTGANGAVSLRDQTANEAVLITADAVQGSAGLMVGAYKPAGGRPGWIAIRNHSGEDTIYLAGDDCQISVRNETGQGSILLDGNNGDIVFQNADCAEEFDASPRQTIVAGTVVVIDVEGRLTGATEPYDRSVVGVVSGAGEHQPALLLDKKPDRTDRLPSRSWARSTARWTQLRRRLRSATYSRPQAHPGTP
jgi:hypothetical protein